MDELSGADGQSPGRVVAGRYRLEGVLGRGGMGVVWRAVDTLIERTVVIKELRAPTGSVEGDRSSFAALGATLFHAVAGRAPFDRDTTTASLRAILFEEPPPPPCEPRLAQAITGLLTRPVDQRLTSDAARQRLQPVAATPASPTSPLNAAPGASAGQSAWEAQATTLHPPSAPPPPPPAPAPAPLAPVGQATTQPAAQPPQHPAHPQVHPATLTPGQGRGGPGMAPQGPPPQGPPPQGPTSGPGWGGPPPQRNRTPWILGGVGAAAAVLILLFASIAGGGGKTKDGPKAALERLLKADQEQDLEAAKAALCREDLSNDVLVSGLTSTHIRSYTIGSVEKDGDVSIVHATLHTTSGRDIDAKVPVAQEDGTWKPCFSRGNGGEEIADSPSDTTGTKDTTDSSTSSATGAGTCYADQSDPLSVAKDYVSAVEYGVPDDAQACVYQDSVPESVTKQIDGHSFIFSSGTEPGPYVFKDNDGTTLTVTLIGSDGKYWITDVMMS